jgi:hypothetical protein
MGQKPDDRWALPLSSLCHLAQHHNGNELAWWETRGVSDPFKLAIECYERYREEKFGKAG